MFQSCTRKFFQIPPFRLLLVFCFAPLLRKCIADFPPPTKIVGIFKHENCAPAMAITLAVHLFNTSKERSLDFSYEFILGDAISKLTDGEITAKLNSSVIVTGEPFLCERLSKILHEMSSFMVCYGIPTEKTLELLESQSNLYLSRPNPDALVNCLFKLIKLIIGDQKEAPTASLIVNNRHSYRHIVEELLFNLPRTYIHFNEIFNIVSQSHVDRVGSLPRNILNATFINAILFENEARNLLCHYFHNDYSIGNQTLIFVGLPTRHWLHSIDNLNVSYNATSTTCKNHNKMRQEQFSCSRQELRQAAEGHLLLEYPILPWTSSDNEGRNITFVKRDLKRRLQNSTETMLDYNEAPLVFDSVWAILKAIDRAFRRNGQVSGESVGQSLIAKPFNGITGETFSFIKYRYGNGGCVRNTADATINIYRFENGDYVQIGRHFNANNNSFQWAHHLFSEGGGRHTWKPTRPKCPNSSKFWKSEWLLLMFVTSLLLTVSLSG